MWGTYVVCMLCAQFVMCCVQGICGMRVLCVVYMQDVCVVVCCVYCVGYMQDVCGVVFCVLCGVYTGCVLWFAVCCV